MQANFNHHIGKKSSCLIVKNTVEIILSTIFVKEMRRLDNITLVAPAGEAANANTRIEKSSWNIARGTTDPGNSI